MELKQFVSRITPSFVKNQVRIWRDLNQLKGVQRVECKTDKLRSKRDLSIGDILSSEEIEAKWLKSEKEIKRLGILDGKGLGVNPGDARAIYYIISAIKPLSVLEIGTHIGVSTIHIASALRDNRNGDPHLITVDIIDVNSQIEKPWLRWGVKHSPIEMIDKLGCGSFVNFVVENSLKYLIECRRTFDLVFLDGDHLAATVYQEIPLALNLLNQNGIILMHDYFPCLKPLWSDRSVIPGPYIATEKLRREGLNVAVLPLNRLPWPTKLGSNVTSLAILLREE